MINRGATLVSRLAMLFAVLFALAACGGGGGGSTFFDEDGSSSSGSSGSSGSSSSGGTTPTLALALFDPLGVGTDTVTASSPGTLKVSIPGGGANILVSVETDIGTILPASATTTIGGEAAFQITAGTETGVGTIKATATTSDGVTITGSLTFQVKASTLSLVLLDSLGNETNTVTSSAPGTLRVTIDGNAANVLVSATTTIGVIFPPSGTALTNTDGVANFQIDSGTVKGAGTVTVTANTSAGAISGSLAFQVGDSGLRLGSYDSTGTFVDNQILIEPGSTLSAGGNAQLSVVVLNGEGNRVTTAEDVRFSSGCVAAGLATNNPAVSQSVNGKASTLFSATGCSGTDRVTASLVGADAQAFGELTIAAPTSNSVNFISAEPLLIVLRGTGGLNRDETSDVVFRVLDGSGTPLPGVTVGLSLTTYVGGLSLSKTSALSNGDGEVTVTVRAGDVATVVRVLASVTVGSEIFSTASDLLTVTTGLPDQDSISLSVEKFIVPLAFNVDGKTTTLTVRMADKFNNPVVTGTAAVFTTEYGAIVGNCSTDDTGACSVDWTSSNPRFPTLSGTTNIKTINNTDCPDFFGVNFVPCPSDLGYTRGARSTILVHAIGEESFIDRNGNGYMDENEKDLFSNLSEAFIDHNEDDLFTPDEVCNAAPGSSQCKAGFEEEFVDFNSNGVFDSEGTSPLYNGLLCPVEGDGEWCSRTLLNVWDDAVVTLSDDSSWAVVMVRVTAPFIVEVVNTTVTDETQTVYISDQFNNAPPAGSTINLSVDDNCEIFGQTDFVVPVLFSQGAFGIPVVTRPSDDTGERGTFSVNFNPAEGNPVVATFDCDTTVPSPPAP